MKKKIVIILILICSIIGLYFIDDINKNNNTKLVSYNGNNLRISIDGVSASALPTIGTYYLTDYDCNSRSTTITWDKTNYKLNISNGNKKAGVACYVEFKSTPLLSEMPVGSYVEYTGDNGCSGESCNGQNANYVDDNDMGYCYNSKYKFIVNGWRIGYIKDGSAHLISAGAPECVKTYVDDYSSTTISKTMNAYYYGSGYTFDESVGRYTLTGVTSSTLVWSSNYSNIIANTPYTCGNTSTSCTTMYKVDSSSTSSTAYVYTYYIYEQTGGVPVHLKHLNDTALKYCNINYANGEICNSDIAWAMNGDDFNIITGSGIVVEAGKYSNKASGYNNDLVDNGGYYWFATDYTNPNNGGVGSYIWHAGNRLVNASYSHLEYGLRPVLNLSSSIVVTGGTGTYDDPYEIANNHFYIDDDNTLNSGDDLSNVTLNLVASSNVTRMCISVDTSVCTNYIEYADSYVLNWAGETDGEKEVYVYYKDSSGEIVASMHRTIVIDTTTS